MRSGWKAQLYIGHLPTCATPALRAWGLAPTGKILWPLNGDGTRKQFSKEFGKDLIKKQQDKSGDLIKITTRDKPLHPSRVITPKLLAVIIKSNRVNLRRCANTSCKIVGKINGGKHLGYIVEEQGQWALLQLNAGAGWMARRLFSISAVTK